jgi:YidC/Oxa1 family membrane protein insertase
LGILNPIYDAVSWVLVTFHTLFTKIGLSADSGIAWTLSIVGLVVVIRTLLIPLFVKQIKAQRGLQVLQPQIKEIQKKYKNDRERQSQEMMKLYRETGTNPLSSCLPLLAQSPIFFGLFHVLNGVSRNPENPPGVFTPALAESMAHATFFGAPLSETFLGADTTSTKVVIAVMVLLMSATMFFTQKQLMSKNMPVSATSSDNPFAQQQKILLYVMPGIFLFSGLGFPIGVLLYWVTSNIWTAGQQFYVIRRNPTPGSRAELELRERRAKRGKSVEGKTAGPAAPAKGPDTGAQAPGAAGSPGSPAAGGGQRQQPKRAGRGKRGTRPAQPSGSGPGAGSPGGPAKPRDERRDTA